VRLRCYLEINLILSGLTASQLLTWLCQSLSRSQTVAAICENYHFNYLYHRAFGIEDINLYSFVIRTLYHFRERLTDYAVKTGKDLFSELFKDGRDDIIKELGLNTETQRLDSVMIRANIKNMSRITLFHKVLSNLIKDVKQTGIEISNTLEDIVKQDEEGYAYRLKKSQLKDKTIELGNQIYIYTERFKYDSSINSLKSYKDAVRLISEQCNIRENFKIELKESKEISSSSMQNPADTDATYRTKNDKAHKGYSTMAVETCDKSNPIQVITHIETVPNNVDDAKILADCISTITSETNLKTVIVDGGFVSDDVRDKAQVKKVQVIATAIKGKTSEKKLDSTDFIINENNLIEKCPNGKSPISQKLEANGTLIANFDPKVCCECPLKNDCIAFKNEKQSKIKIDTKRRWIDERNKNLGTDTYLRLCKMRPPVESLMEKLKPKHLSGKTKFKSLNKVRQRMSLRAIGLNFKRYANHILEKARELYAKLRNLLLLATKPRFHNSFLQGGHFLDIRYLLNLVLQRIHWRELYG
jgi:Transposase DDE domain